MKMAPFPSPLERTVASALLLLSTMPQLPSPPSSCKLGFESKKKSFSSSSRASKSCVSSLSSDASSSKEKIRASNKLRIVAVVASCHDFKLKVVRKKRTQVSWKSGHRQIVLPSPSVGTTESAKSAEESCLSSISSPRSRYSGVKANQRNAAQEKEKPVKSGSAHMRRQAEAILNFLSDGCFSEVRIRQVVGDSPDTSKALRMLLKKEVVKRSGSGGHRDPFIYKLA